MEPQQTIEKPQTQHQRTNQRGNFYMGLGFALMAGLIITVVAGLVGLNILGASINLFSASTAWAMTGIAIAMIAVVSFVTLVSMRRTLALLNKHEEVLASQAARHADLAAHVQSQWRAKQVVRDRNQDKALATLSARQDNERATVRPNGNHARVTGVAGDPFEGGQVHAVIDVEGIGAHYANLLVGLGVKDTKQLWNTDPAYLAGALDVTREAVDGWQSMAELMAITGIGKQYAELLVRAGVPSIGGLAGEAVRPLLARIQKLEKRQRVRIQGNTIGPKVVQSWIDAARVHSGLDKTIARGA